MYDHLTSGLINVGATGTGNNPALIAEEDERQQYALSLVRKRSKRLRTKTLEDGLIEHQLKVQGKNLYKTTVCLDTMAGSAFKIRSLHRRHKLRQGPLPTLLMASLIEIGR